MSLTAAPPPAPPRPRRMTGPLAAGIEVVSIIAALGVGQLVAALIAPASAPFQAVADTVVRLSPEGLTEFGKGLDFSAIGLGPGVADKVSLLVGIGIVVLGIAVAAGTVSRDRPGPGVAVIVALGLVGVAAVAFSPVFTPVFLVAPVTALVAGVAAFAGLRALATRVDPAGPGTYPDGTRAGSPSGPTRRGVLAAVAAVGVAGAAAGVFGLVGGGVGRTREAVRRILPGRPAPPIPPGADFADVGTPTFLTANRDFYRIDTALRVPSVSAADWSLRVHGMVGRELTLDYQQLLSRPLVEKTITMTCVSNEVNGPLISTADFTGVSLRDVLLEAGVSPGAEQLFSTSVDGWTAGTPLDVVLDPAVGALLAVAMNGDPLPAEHGYPVRMVVPGQYGYVSATKWLADLELTTFDAQQAYWLQRGWGRLAPIKTQSRVDVPRPLSTVTPGPGRPVTLAGIAWAQTRGIDRVEVRLDRTGPWQPAQLSTEVNDQTWRMWRLDVPLAAGAHFVECRATDRTGATQTDRIAAPIPDGATGWPGIAFTVA